MHRREFIGMGALALAFGARAQTRAPAPDPAFDPVFARMAPQWVAVARDPAHAVRLRWIRIERDNERDAERDTEHDAERGRDGRRRFRIHDFGAERDRVWAPAASVAKLPMALLMAEAVQAAGGGADSVLRLDAPPATGNWGDEPLAEVFARGIDRTFAVSDNRPFNRWYELLGGDRVHRRLGELGYPHARLIARLGSSDREANRRSGGGAIETADGRVLARSPPAQARARRFPFGEARLGAGWQNDDGTLVPGPHDFSRANFLPLADSLRMLQAFVSPESVPPAQRWRIDGALRNRLLRALALRPRDCEDPVYPESDYPDGHARWFFVGDGRERYAPGLSVFGKTGMAYGSLSEVAWVVDRDAGVECLLAARILVNADGIYNDDRYEYDGIGLPFLAAWSRAVLDVEREHRSAQQKSGQGRSGRQTSGERRRGAR